MTRKKQQPTQISDALKSLLKKGDLGERIEEAAIVPEWAERVGPQIAAVTVPMRVNHGTLWIGVRSSAWMNELNLMETEILGRLNAGRQRGKISKIRFQMLEQ